LRGIYRAIKDGEARWADYVEKEDEGTNADKLTDRLKKEKEMAPLPCPNKPDTTYTKEHCDKQTCRKGCPVWE